MRHLKSSATIAMAALLFGYAQPCARAQDAGQPAYDDAQGSQQADPASFEQALAPYGDWIDGPYGRAWAPAAARDQSWQPYTAGQWLYSDYGWYFKSDEDFGWIVYHYGRWLPDSSYGWIWVPDTTWGPAWVAWRQGDDFLGWSPLPPEASGYDIESAPVSWIFVSTSSFTRPDIRSYSFPRGEVRDRFLQSRFHNQAQRRNDGAIGHNTGIDPGIVAGATGRPLRPYEIRPQIFPGTVGIIDGRRIVGRRDNDFSEPRRETAQERRVPPTDPVYSTPSRRFENPSDGRDGYRGAPGATGAPQVGATPMTAPIPSQPASRPVPQPPSEGTRPNEDRYAPRISPGAVAPPQPIQRPVIEQPQIQPIQRPQVQQQLPVQRLDAPQQVNPVPMPNTPPASVQSVAPRLTPLNQQRPVIVPQTQQPQRDRDRDDKTPR